MNLLAGFLYLIYNDEAIAFKMFAAFITELNLSNMYKKDVPLLKMYFHQLNKIMAIYLPKLHAHLLEEGINSAYFSSPWFLTAFTYILQHLKSPGIPNFLITIFEQVLLVTIYY